MRHINPSENIRNIHKGRCLAVRQRPFDPVYILLSLMVCLIQSLSFLQPCIVLLDTGLSQFQ